MRVVVGEDETLLRRGLVLVLQQAGFDVVGQAPDADALIRSVTELAPDLVVTDIRMPPTHTDEGVRAALTIRSTLPSIGIVVLSQHVQRQYAVELLHGGAAGLGYLLKQRISDVDTFGQDLRRVAAGGTVLDPEVVAMMVARSGHQGRGIERLTARQRQVLELMAEGCSNAAIAQRLTMSEKVVVQHASRIYDELELHISGSEHRRVLAVLQWLNA